MSLMFTRSPRPLASASQRLEMFLPSSFDIRRTIWILRQRCYILGPPVCYEEYCAFEPPCPSLLQMRKIRNDAQDLELWKEQLLHEQQVVPVQCPQLSPTQECLLHLAVSSGVQGQVLVWSLWMCADSRPTYSTRRYSPSSLSS